MPIERDCPPQDLITRYVEGIKNFRPILGLLSSLLQSDTYIRLTYILRQYYESKVLHITEVT